MAKQIKGGGENEYHVVGVRMRVVGSGDLELSLTDLDQQQSFTIDPIVMQSSTRFEPTKLANFQSQRIRLEGRTIHKDEIFTISRIVIYAKPVAVEYPEIS